MATAHQPQMPSSQEKEKTVSQDAETQLIVNFTKKRIIPTFRAQKRWRGKQYAVVNFWSEYDCKTGLQAVQFTPEPELDPTKLSVPLTLCEDIGCNYIVARPKGSTKHAEKILMNRLDSLYEAYTGFTGKQPAAIYIHSYYMPCVKCARLITTTLRTAPRYWSIPVIVAYTSEYNDSDSIAEKIFQDNNCFVLQAK